MSPTKKKPTRIDYVQLNKRFTSRAKNNEIRTNLNYLHNMVSPTKRHQVDGSIAPPNSIDGGPSSNGEMQADQSLAEAAGSPSGSGDSTNIGFEYIHKPHTSNSRFITYRNTIMANSWGYAYKQIKNTIAAVNWAELMTPLAVIPVNQL